MVGMGTGRRMTRPGGRVVRRPESGIPATIVALQAAFFPQSYEPAPPNWAGRFELRGPGDS
jgi:hypothetical protein